MEGLELICFEIISYSGSARSSFIESMEYAKNNDFEKAKEMMKQGEKEYAEAHKSHSKLIQEEAAEKPVQVNLMLIHAEDQLMSAEVIRIMAEEIISLRQERQMKTYR